jgi:hypothetical protein
MAGREQAMPMIIRGEIVRGYIFLYGKANGTDDGSGDWTGPSIRGQGRIVIDWQVFSSRQPSNLTLLTVAASGPLVPIGCYNLFSSKP